MSGLPASVAPALRALLDDCAGFEPEYGAGLSNHQPMALVALARLGADAAQLRRFAARYAAAKKLQPARARAAWPAGDAWQGRFGQPAALPVYRDLFNQWLAQEGAADMLRQVLPPLLRGSGAAAFHGLIRTACALQAAHAGELVEGLAYWAASYLPFGELPEAAQQAGDPAALLRGLSAGRSNARLITRRMADAAAGGAVNAAAARLRIDEGTPERLARAAAFAYAETGNFTALHLVTGTHAMRIVAAHVEEPLPAWRWFWQAYAHGVVAARLQAAARPAPLRDWPALAAAALASEDEHVIKLVDACREEAAFYAQGTAAGEGSGAIWARAASRTLG